MTTTTQVREWWAPACKANQASLQAAYEALDECLKMWKYAPKAGETGAFNCRPITNGTGYSLHAYDPDGYFTFWSGVRITKAIAVDVNWNENPYGPVLKTDMPSGMIADIKKIKTKNGKQVWRWGGDYSGNKDAMHFEIIVSPADLATGVVGAYPAGAAPLADEVESHTKEGKPVLIIRKAKREHQLLVSGGGTLVAHQPLVEPTPTTPTILVDDVMWNWWINFAKYTHTFLDPRP